MENKVETRLTRSKSYLVSEEVVWLFAKLPPESKKFLAMYHQKNMRFLEMATWLGFTETDICQRQAKSVALLQIQMSFPVLDGVEKEVNSFERRSLLLGN